MKFKCIICNNETYEVIQNYAGTVEGFLNKSIVECKECTLKSIFPLPTEFEIDKYYQSYWEKIDTSEIIELFEAQAESRLSKAKEFIKTPSKLKRVLDIGAGMGLSKNYLPNDIVYHAIEIDPDACNVLINTVKADKVFTGIEDAENEYDLVIMAHIIEHLSSPQNFLKSLRERISQLGFLLVEVPNLDYLYKPRNQPHLYFFSPDTLIKLLHSAGYQVLFCDTCGARVEELGLIHGRHLKALKYIAKLVLPRKLIALLVKGTNKTLARKVTRNVAEYGGNRQWIRLIAKP